MSTGTQISNLLQLTDDNTFLIKNDQISELSNLKVASNEKEFLAEAEKRFNKNRLQKVLFEVEGNPDIQARLTYAFNNVLRQQGYTKALNSFIKFYIRYKYNSMQYKNMFQAEEIKKNQTFLKKSDQQRDIHIQQLLDPIKVPNAANYQIRKHKNELYYLCQMQGEQLIKYQLISLKYIYKQLGKMKKLEYLNLLTNEQQKNALQSFLQFQTENQSRLFDKKIKMMGKPKGKFAKTRKFVKDYMLNIKNINYAKRKFKEYAAGRALEAVDKLRQDNLDSLTADRVIKALDANDVKQRQIAKKFVESQQQIIEPRRPGNMQDLEEVQK